MRKIFYILGFSAVTALSSCKDPEPADPPQPVIVFTEPQENQLFHFGDTIPIHGAISSSQEMHGYNVRLFNVETNMNVLNQGYHEHGSAFEFSEGWTNTVADTTEMIIYVEAAIDHDGNTYTQQRSILCYPQ